MYCSFQFGQCPDVTDSHLKIHVLFKTLGCDNFPQQIDHFFALSGDFHFYHGIKEQVPAVIQRSRTQVITGPQGKQFHCGQADVCIHKELLDMRKIGYSMVEQPAVSGMVQRLIKGMSADADGSPAKIKLSDIYRIQAVIPSLGAFCEN